MRAPSRFPEIADPSPPPSPAGAAAPLPARGRHRLARPGPPPPCPPRTPPLPPEGRRQLGLRLTADDPPSAHHHVHQVTPLTPALNLPLSRTILGRIFIRSSMNMLVTMNVLRYPVR